MLEIIEGMKVTELKRDPNPAVIEKTKAIIKDPKWPKHTMLNFNVASIILTRRGSEVSLTESSDPLYIDRV